MSDSFGTEPMAWVPESTGAGSGVGFNTYGGDAYQGKVSQGY